MLCFECLFYVGFNVLVIPGYFSEQFCVHISKFKLPVTY